MYTNVISDNSWLEDPVEEEVVDGVPPEIGLVLKKGGKIQIFQIFDFDWKKFDLPIAVSLIGIKTVWNVTKQLQAWTYAK